MKLEEVDAKVWRSLQDLGCRVPGEAKTPGSVIFDSMIDEGDPLMLGKFRFFEGKIPEESVREDFDLALTVITRAAAALDIHRYEEPEPVPCLAVGLGSENACGIGAGKEASTVVKAMVLGDPYSLLGGCVITNFSINFAIAQTMLTAGQLLGHQSGFGVIIAPSFSSRAMNFLTAAHSGCCFAQNPALGMLGKNSLTRQRTMKQVRGGFFYGESDTSMLSLREKDLHLTSQQEVDLLLAWAVAAAREKYTSIAIVKNGQLLGSSSSRGDRVDIVRFSLKRASYAGHDVRGAVVYANKALPLLESLEALVAANITIVFSSGGDVRDGEAKAACAERGITLHLV